MFRRKTRPRIDLNVKPWANRVTYLDSRIVLITAIAASVVYLATVTAVDFAIYKHDTNNRFTRLVERIFPYPAVAVNRQVVPLSRFRKEVEAREYYSKQNQLNIPQKDIEHLVATQLVDKALYAQDLSNHHLTVSNKDIDASLDTIYSQIGGKDKLNSFLADKYGPDVTLTDFRQWIQESLVESAIQHNILVQVSVQHILISVPDNASADQVEAARKKALDVKSKITSVDQFGAIAKQYSEDVSSRDKDGQLGTTVRGSDSPVYSADFENAIFTMPLHQVSDPIRSPFGWHLVIVDTRTGTVDKSMKDYTQDLLNKAKWHIYIGK